MRSAYTRTWNLERKEKNEENETEICMTWNMARNSEILGKWEKLNVRPGIWQETLKTWKMRNGHFRIWNRARNTEKHRK